MKTIEQLQEENAALMAQVEALRGAIKKTSDTGKMIHIMNAYDETPQHHLREVRAEAGRAGFVAGFKLGTQTAKPTAENCYPAAMVDFVSYQIEKFANIKAHEYVDQIMRGEAG